MTADEVLGALLAEDTPADVAMALNGLFPDEIREALELAVRRLKESGA